MLKSVLLVGCGSFVGGALRYVISCAMKSCSTGFPYGTLLVNLLGCLLIGVLYGVAAKHTALSKDLVLLLATGLCGGFTTFSTFANESLLMLQAHQYTAFILYILISIVLGLLATLLGYAIVKGF